MNIVINNKFKIVILDSVISNWSHPVVSNLFNQIIQLKLQGYGSEYSAGVISIDTTDFIGTHLLICEELSDRNSFKVLAGYKSITLERCKFHRILFPALQTIRSSNVEAVEQTALKEILGDFSDNKKKISYDSSWTKDSTLKKDRELNLFIKNLITTIGFFYHKDYNIPEWITCGVHRFKTDLYFRWMGLTQISQPFPQFSLANELVTMFHLKQYSTAAIETANQYKLFWKNRTDISSTITSNEQSSKISA